MLGVFKPTWRCYKETESECHIRWARKYPRSAVVSLMNCGSEKATSSAGWSGVGPLGSQSGGSKRAHAGKAVRDAEDCDEERC